MIQELRIGSLLDHGKYEIVKVLGQGGYGTTYLARDLGLDKLRAIKEFFPKDFCDRDTNSNNVILGTRSNVQFMEQLKAKFIKEARNIASLDQHHGIVRIHSVFEENNTAYYVMDYIEGESLSDIVKLKGRLYVDKSVKYISQVGEALAYVHSHHVNHLDVKPANIMVRQKDDMPILIDFGLSKQYDSEGNQTSTSPTGISHGFAPLEQYNMEGVKEFSPQTDVYSLAATLCYLITATVPPHAPELIDTQLSLPEWLPENLKKAIRRGMASSRKARFATVAQFIKEINLSQDNDNNVIMAQSIEPTVNRHKDSFVNQKSHSQQPSGRSQSIPVNNQPQRPSSTQPPRQNVTQPSRQPVTQQPRQPVAQPQIQPATQPPVQTVTQPPVSPTQPTQQSVNQPQVSSVQPVKPSKPVGKRPEKHLKKREEQPKKPEQKQSSPRRVPGKPPKSSNNQDNKLYQRPTPMDSQPVQPASQPHNSPSLPVEAPLNTGSQVTPNSLRQHEMINKMTGHPVSKRQAAVKQNSRHVKSAALEYNKNDIVSKEPRATVSRKNNNQPNTTDRRIDFDSLNKDSYDSNRLKEKSEKDSYQTKFIAGLIGIIIVIIVLIFIFIR